MYIKQPPTSLPYGMLLKAWVVSSTVTRKLPTEVRYLHHNTLKVKRENVPEYWRAQIFECNLRNTKIGRGDL